MCSCINAAYLLRALTFVPSHIIPSVFDTDNLLDQSKLGIFLPLQFNPHSATPSHILPLEHNASPSGVLTLD